MPRSHHAAWPAQRWDAWHSLMSLAIRGWWSKPARRARSSSAARPSLRTDGRGPSPPGAIPRTCAASPTAQPESGGRCSSCSRPPAMIASAPAPRVRSPMSALGWTKARAGGRIYASAASVAARLRRSIRGSLVRGATERPASRSTRLRAVAVLGPGPHRGDAEIALETTRRHLADALPYAIDDLSLCHGLGGAADVLLHAAAAFGLRWHQRGAGGDGVGTRDARALCRSRPTVGRAGTEGETTPGLFLGLSGIGWLFLRLHDPATPTPLAPSRYLTTRVRWT